jgi:predicted S18 family serine protease
MPRLLHQYSLLIGSLFLLLFTACATTAPVQEMSNARQTIQAAVEAGAEVHAPDELANARELLKDASRELEVGNYPLAREYALQAKQQAMQARQAAILKAHQKE